MGSSGGLLPGAPALALELTAAFGMPSSRRTVAVLLGAALLAPAACSRSEPPPPSDTGQASDSTAPAPTAEPSPSAGVPAPSVADSPSPAADCAQRVLDAMDPSERAGQLLMVGLTASAGADSLRPLLRDQHVGSVVYLGGWRDAARVKAASASLQEWADDHVGLLVAADQEGGQVQQLTGSGFTTLPSALAQGAKPAADLTALWSGAARELAGAGVNVNLAPVADVVAKGDERTNAPIGRYSRQYGSESTQVSRAVRAVVTGLTQGQVAATVKHFPGLGRVSGNTDVTAEGITDATTSPTDPNLAPFAAGIDAGAGLVMVSLARYPALDPANPAVFSPAVVDGLLRTTMGYRGVVITDDVGVAKAVTDVPAADRATRTIAAGGDLVLTAQPGLVGPMAAAIRSRAERDPAFAEKVRASTARVLALKGRMGLLHCS
ncbi:MAG: glycoside hydrolase family 3 N-terminal domain-containing protein [Dermatophilaceae bacterium]